MVTRRVVEVLLVLMWFGVLFLSGCANYLKPELGAIARPEARIDLAKEGVQDAVWSTKDLVITYSFSESDNIFNMSGKLIFDRSLTDSFPVVKRFFLKMNFLDGEGSVLESVDISPLIRSFGMAPDDPKTIKVSCPRPAGAVAMAFNYFGVFRGAGEEMGSSDWEIFYFPFD